MTALGELPLYIDSTMINTFRSCPKKFYWEYIECLRPMGRKVDLVAGAAFAAALEATYIGHYAHGLDQFNSLREGLQAFIIAWGTFPHEQPGSYKSFDRTFQAVIDYIETYGFESDHVRPLMRDDGKPTFEFSMAIPLSDPKFPRHPSGDPFILSGRFDAFGTLDSRMVIRDEKTSGRAPSSNWSQQWDLRNQFLGYCWGCQQIGYQVDTVVVRGITIQKTQFHHVEAIKIYPQFLIDRFADQLARDLHRVVDCFNSGYFDYNLGDACSSYGNCAFLILDTDPIPSRWFSEFSRERWNPLARTSDPIEAPHVPN